MPLLYEIDEAQDERPLHFGNGMTCVTCKKIDVGTIDVDGRTLTVGFCPDFECFMNEAELNEDRQDKDCWG